ncbi:hypothetical protein AB0M80_18470 [Amycolatopsis sp. NPDC051045]|uniref:hypothetical protein n=1 Tax=Amycolatopsis sp. NPDC051045 TaxID=3156922 RepID=UPI0034410D8F
MTLSGAAPGTAGFPAPALQPEQRALHNLLERDRMFTDRLRAETEALGLHAIELDTGTTEDELADRVARLFGF